MVTAAKSLSEALSYAAPEIVKRFQHDHSASEEESQALFLDCKRWLWACAKNLQDAEQGMLVPKRLLITPELKRLDEMWHCFLLFTREYHEFCERYLGRFIHHIPLTSEELRSFDHLRQLDPKQAREQRRDAVRPQLSYLYDLLGPDVLARWYLGRE